MTLALWCQNLVWVHHRDMSEFVELSEQECRELLGSDVIGRVAFNTPAGPRIVPVNFVVEADAVEWRTTAYSELATYATDQRVAFEVDHLDRERRRGWSVIALGVCTRVDVFDDEGADPEPWAAGNRQARLRLEWSEISGRRVGGQHWPHPVVSRRS